jgi:hypothetical protein
MIVVGKRMLHACIAFGFEHFGSKAQGVHMPGGGHTPMRSSVIAWLEFSELRYDSKCSDRLISQ